MKRKGKVKERDKIRNRGKFLKVITYSGSKGDEHPVEVHIGKRRLKVIEWISLGKEEIGGERREGFLIKTKCGEVYFLYHYLEDERWIILKKN